MIDSREMNEAVEKLVELRETNPVLYVNFLFRMLKPFPAPMSGASPG